MYKIFVTIEFVGKTLFYLPKCHSTNDIAADLLKQGLIDHGAIVITNHQIAGRGQRENTWESTKGKNLTFSTMLKPESIQVENHFYLNLITSLAITDVLLEIEDGFRIKWPNDIYYKHQKIGGILIENSVLSGKIISTIIGIGLNINQDKFSENINAISLFNIVGKEFNLNNIFNKLIQRLDQRWLDLINKKFEQLKLNYHNRLFWMGENHQFRDHKGIFSGIIDGIDRSGKLIIRNQDGQRIYDNQEIVFLK